MAEHGIVLFDGVCNFCNSSVNFIIDKDPKGYFRFAALQSETGQDILRQFNLPTEDFNSLILVEDNRYYTKSTGALRIAKRLKGFWSWGAIFLVVPAFLRNPIYDLIARNRYKWFGKSDQCRLPTPEYRERFLEISATPL